MNPNVQSYEFMLVDKLPKRKIKNTYHSRSKLVQLHIVLNAKETIVLSAKMYAEKTFANDACKKNYHRVPQFTFQISPKIQLCLSQTWSKKKQTNPALGIDLPHHSVHTYAVDVQNDLYSCRTPNCPIPVALRSIVAAQHGNGSEKKDHSYNLHEEDKEQSMYGNASRPLLALATDLVYRIDLVGPTNDHLVDVELVVTQRDCLEPCIRKLTNPPVEPTEPLDDWKSKNIELHKFYDDEQCSPKKKRHKLNFELSPIHQDDNDDNPILDLLDCSTPVNVFQQFASVLVETHQESQLQKSIDSIDSIDQMDQMLLSSSESDSVLDNVSVEPRPEPINRSSTSPMLYLTPVNEQSDFNWSLVQ